MSSHSNSEGGPKASKVQLRLRPAQKALIVRAADIRQMTLSDFVLEHALSAAEEVVAEQTYFALSKKQWLQFCAALDAPPRDIPALRRLLAEKGVLDGQ